MFPNKTLLITALTTILLVIGPGKAGNKSEESFDQLWQQALQLNEKQLPQSALLVVNRIYDKALAENNPQQMLRAMIFGFSLRKSFEDGVFNNAIGQTRQLISQSDFPVRAIAHSLLAEMYWFHYQENRYRILERETTAAPEASDPDEWDAPRYRDQILHHYQQSIRNQAELERISLKDWDILLEKHDTTAIELQPTLFDFLAGRYLRFLEGGDAALQSRLPLSQALPDDIWQPATLFATLDLPRQDHETLLRLRIMQRILTSNIRLGNTFALIHNDLQRYRWLSQVTGNQQAYFEALSRLRQQYLAHPASTEIDADLAELLRSNTAISGIDMPLAQALRICDEAIARHPDSRGAQRCKALRAEIQASSLRLIVSRTEYPGKPIPALLTYRNLTRPAFRIARVTKEQLSQINQSFDHQTRVKALLQLPVQNQWQLELPFEPDYAEHSSIIALPALNPGLYVVLASDQNDFSPERYIAYTTFQVSSMSFMQVNRKGTNNFVLLDRHSGKPVAGAKVSVAVREYDYGQQKTVEKTLATFLTPRNGEFLIGPDLPGLPRNRSFYLEISKNGDTLLTDNYFDASQRTEAQRSLYKSWIFTDRAIYRPGQIIYFKGISLAKHPGSDWTTNTAAQSTVRLFDVNGRELQALRLKTNEYGSFEGSFVLPATMLTGQVRIGNEHGNSFVHVEEYKRPTFEVKILPTDVQLMLGDSLRFKAEARAFAGYPVDGAKVDYRIERREYFPWMPWWRVWPTEPVSQLIGQGSTLTRPDGSFDIPFVALPDFSRPIDDEQYYDYVVTAWVTDRTGETRQSSTSLRIGNRSLILSAQLPRNISLQQAHNSKILLNTTQGRPAAAQTTFSFYLIETGRTTIRPAIFDRPDRRLLDEQSLKTLFPNDDFYAPYLPDSLPKKLILTYHALVNGSAPALPETLAQWPEGEYLAEYQTTDHAGNPVRLQQRFTLHNPASSRTLPEQFVFAEMTTGEAKPGDTLSLVLASSLRGMRLLVELSSDDELFLRRWVSVNNRKQVLHFTLTRAHIGKLTVQVSGIALNRHFHQAFDINVNDPERQLDLKLETIAGRLQPGRPETWTVRITGNNGKPVAAELLAAMYDASLEQFKPHTWRFDPLPPKPFAQRWMSDNGFGTTQTWIISSPPHEPIRISDLSPPTLQWYDFGHHGFRFTKRMSGPMDSRMIALESAPGATLDRVIETPDQTAEQPATSENTAVARNLRSDFRETAFFYPQLQTDSLGGVSFSFTPPDALTRWRLMLLAHTTDLRHAFLTHDIESSKPLMVVPNLARFYRLGDTAVIACKVVNTGNQVLDGMAMLELTNALNNQPAGQLQDAARKPFVQLQPGQSAELRWSVVLHTNASLLRFQLSASAGAFTDAEAHLVPLLPAGIRLTETLPMFVQGNRKAAFTLPGLEKPSPAERTLSLRLDVTTHPAWIAVKALPYVVDPGAENADNIFRQFYTNTLAAHVAASIPNFEAVLAAWNSSHSNALHSELQNNQELKMQSIEQTPWLRDAEDEHSQRLRLQMFFDHNRIRSEREQTLQKLARLQLPDGSWPWFPGMRGNLWITLNILHGFGKLTELDSTLATPAEVQGMLHRAIAYIDRQAAELYAKDTGMRNVGGTPLQLLVTRSYFGSLPRSPEAEKAYQYFESLLEKDWNKLVISEQAMASLHYRRTNNMKAAARIAASLAERAVRSEKLGIWWKAGRTDNQALPVETQALLVQVFELIGPDRSMADGIRQYLLSQKQTRRWISGQATAEAVYALLTFGSDWTSPGKPVEVKVAGQPVEVPAQEAGSGQFSLSWTEGMNQAMAKVEIDNPNPGPAWAGMFRQYEVPVDAVRQNAGYMRLSREILVEKASPAGIVFEPWRSQGLKPGDRIRVRLVLETDRDMEFVHLSDLRSPAFEPVEVLSGYQWRTGLGYYQSTRDAVTDFYFDLLPRGKHVFEYSLIATHRGQYSGGFARMQSYYAPAFSAHSAGIRVTVD
ncbi:MAG: hypothetical protein IPM52_10610 [Bacteroidetes bacterium]|nr:hypothetical protein [Bacteroidota bacterium]